MAEQFFSSPGAVTPINVLSLIGEMRHDFDALYSEISSIKQSIDEEAPTNTSHTYWEPLLLHLTTQNDRLQEALLETAGQKDTVVLALEHKNESLSCQNDELKARLCRKEHEIAELKVLIDGNDIALEDGAGEGLQCRSRSTTKLSEQINQLRNREHNLKMEQKKSSKEIADLKQKNEELENQVKKLTELLRTQDQYRADLLQKYTQLDESYCKNRDALLEAQQQTLAVQERHEGAAKEKLVLQMTQQMHLQKIADLTESKAVLEGKNKSLQEQVRNSLRELNSQKYLKKQMECEFEKYKKQHDEEISKALMREHELSEKYRQVCNKYNQIEERYKKLLDKSEIQQNILKLFNKWKAAQLEADKNTCNGIEQYETHIQ